MKNLQRKHLIKSKKLLEPERLYALKKNILNDGTETWSLTNRMPLLDLNGNIIGTFGTSIDITQHKQAEEALKNSQNQLKMFAAHLQAVREKERVLLAREIHDELGQILVALKIDLGILENNIVKQTK